MFEIRYNEQNIKALERALKDVPRAMPQIMSRALNRTATMARTQISRVFSKRVGLRVKDVRQRITLQKASYNNWRSAVALSNKRMSLSLLKPRKTTRGYLSVKHQRRRVMIRRAFPALKGWFIRLPEAGGYEQTLDVAEAAEISGSNKKLVGRLPIGRIKGPSIRQVFYECDAEATQIYFESMKRLEQNIADQVKVILARRLAG